MTALVVVLAIGAVARLTRLVVADQITAPVRGWLEERAEAGHPRLGYFVTCPWCVSVWVGGGVAVSAAACGGQTWWQVGAMALLASQVTGLASEWETR